MQSQYQNRSAEREMLMRKLAKALGISEREAYEFRRAYSRGLYKALCLEAFLAIFRPLLQEAKRKGEGL